MVAIDVSILDELSSLDEEPGSPFLVNLVQLFEQKTQDALLKIRSAATAGRLADIAKEAHSLKSSAGNLGAMAVSRISAEIEAAALRQDAAALAPLLAGLDQAVPPAITGLREYLSAK